MNWLQSHSSRNFVPSSELKLQNCSIAFHFKGISLKKKSFSSSPLLTHVEISDVWVSHANIWNEFFMWFSYGLCSCFGAKSSCTGFICFMSSIFAYHQRFIGESKKVISVRLIHSTVCFWEVDDIIHGTHMFRLFLNEICRQFF